MTFRADVLANWTEDAVALLTAVFNESDPVYGTLVSTVAVTTYEAAPGPGSGPAPAPGQTQAPAAAGSGGTSSDGGIIAVIVVLVLGLIGAVAFLAS